MLQAAKYGTGLVEASMTVGCLVCVGLMYVGDTGRDEHGCGSNTLGHARPFQFSAALTGGHRLLGPTASSSNNPSCASLLCGGLDPTTRISRLLQGIWLLWLGVGGLYQMAECIMEGILN